MSAGVLGDASSVATEFGRGSFRYRVAEEWSGMSSGFKLKEVPAVATDSNDRVYVFNRGNMPMLVFDGVECLFYLTL